MAIAIASTAPRQAISARESTRRSFCARPPRVILRRLPPEPPLSDPLASALERRRDESDPAAVGFVLQLGRALHSYGYSAQRIEDILGATSDRLGLHGYQFFSTPTSIMASFGPIGRQRTHMLRVEPGEVNLGKLTALEQLSVEVARGTQAPRRTGTAAITRIAARAVVLRTGAHHPRLWRRFGRRVCQFLGGGGREVLVAGVLGLGLGLFALIGAGQPRLGRVFEPLAAFVVSVAAVALAHLVGASVGARGHHLRA